MVRRILHFEMTDNIGGIETFIMNMYKNMDSNDIRFDVITTSRDKIPFEEKLREQNSKIYHIPSPKNIYLYVMEIIRIIRSNNYDIIHIHKNSLVNIIPIIIAYKINGSRVIVHAHNTAPTKGNLKFLHYINRWLLKSMNIRRVACSRKAAKWIFNTDIADQVLIIPNGIKLEQYARNKIIREKIRRKYSLDSDDILIGNVGRLTKQKNQEYLIELLEKLDEKFKLIIIGDGKLRNTLISSAKRRKVLERIIFTGAVQNVNDYLQAVDIFVMPSLFEGLPIAGIEAQAMGIPVLVSDAVSIELKLTSNIEYLRLANQEQWINHIKKSVGKVNHESIEQIRENGYDISQTRIKIRQLYNKILVGNNDCE
ncbi:hypothetical protein FC48_GL001419 [Ligilactobacillus murinus DSM 20452 = NBRC 14221]|uniref:Glycosyltransferase n=1 Tax=Ligilactobacillus murinus DSM 20452 = NBRC 14221 TaxID=1423772 RepID=A0A0R2BC44_9LACO|nr:glycosyltransferase [Ligilactobacillus murinus]KRM76721.1 hypothetical protein FC48_GL001419 [Ligilactobacillus murinus DSM 20452 = NBRC 14221]